MGAVLRNHDELDLSRLSASERQEVYAAFAPESGMQLYQRGIRRRLAPMLGNDRRRVELAFSTIFSLPGTPVIYCGDELGMGEDIALPERWPVRTCMQWSDERNAGFLSAGEEHLIHPVLMDGEYGAARVNATSQQRDPDSLLNWLRRLVDVRQSCPEVGWGEWRAVSSANDAIFALRFRVRVRCFGGVSPRARLVAFLLGPLPPDATVNLADALVAPDVLRPFLTNWADVVRYFIRSVETDAAADGNPDTAALLDRLTAYRGVRAVLKKTATDVGAAPVLPMHFRKGDVSLQLFTTIATLGTPQDVTAQELRIESFFPMDDDTARTLRAWAAKPGSKDPSRARPPVTSLRQAR